VAADVEEGAAAEAVPEAVQVVADAVEGSEPPDEAGGDPLSPGIDGDPDQNLTPLTAALCPMVGANCRGNLETVAMGWLIKGACDDLKFDTNSKCPLCIPPQSQNHCCDIHNVVGNQFHGHYNTIVQIQWP
jgi:hypothetical protein